jgi:signal transduction histidine kinase
MVRFRLKTKVLIPVTFMIVTLFGVALIIVNQVVRTQVRISVSQNLAVARRVFEKVTESDRAVMAERAMITAYTPYLQAAVDTQDSTTVQNVVNDVLATVKSDLLVIVDQSEKILAQRGLPSGYEGKLTDLFVNVYPGEEGIEFGLLAAGDSYFEFVRVAMVSDDAAFGGYLLGHLILGRRVSPEYLRGLQRTTGSELAFVAAGKIMSATFDSSRSLSLSGIVDLNMAGAPRTVNLDDEEFLLDSSGGAANYLLLQSVDRTLRGIMRPIEITMLSVGLFALLAAFLVSTYISREVVNPINSLVNATSAVTSGDYSSPVAVDSADEIGQLAREFDSMRQSLKSKMSELQQQNVELENALHELVQAEKLAATGKITAQLSHELNNPIHNIRGCLEAAQRKMCEDGESREFVDLAHKEVIRIGHLVRQMLNFYRPQIVAVRETDVLQLIHEILKSTQPRFEEAGIDYETHFHCATQPAMLPADQVKQVFLNLVSNAVDAMPDGGRLTVTTTVQGEMVAIRFQDTGSGITPENQEKIFEAFFTTKSKASGVGLGLTVSYGILRTIGGSIDVESKPGKGTAFTVRLPIK